MTLLIKHHSKHQSSLMQSDVPNILRSTKNFKRIGCLNPVDFLPSSSLVRCFRSYFLVAKNLTSDRSLANACEKSYVNKQKKSDRP